MFNKCCSLSNDSESKLTDSYLICLGGEDEYEEYLDSVSIKKLLNGKWRSLSPMPYRLTGFGGAVFENKVYVAGGRRSLRKTDKMYVYNLQYDQWKELPSMRMRRSDFGMATLNGLIYVAGGWDDFSRSCSYVERFNPRNERWQIVTSMNQTRNALKLVSLGGYLYAIGGYKTDTVEKYDPGTDRWSLIANMNYKHFALSAEGFEDQIYVLSHVGFETYHLRTGKWQILPKLSMGWGATLVMIPLYNLWAIGGGTESIKHNSTKKIYRFDLINQIWTRLPDMDVARTFHCSLVIEN